MGPAPTMRERVGVRIEGLGNVLGLLLLGGVLQGGWDFVVCLCVWGFLGGGVCVVCCFFSRSSRVQALYCM